MAQVGELRKRQKNGVEQSSRSIVQPEVSETTAETNRSYFRCSSLIKLIIGFIFLLYVIIPVTFYLSPSLRRHVVFLNYISWPPFMNLSDTSRFGLPCAHNFYVQSESNVQLGAWHILPESKKQYCHLEKEYSAKSAFQDSRPVILYIHGNSGTRGGAHRVKLYKILIGNKIDAHVVTFDYRGYGDSTATTPSTTGVVQDSRAMYDWLSNHVDKSRIFVWGHSLGTAITAQLLDTHADISPTGVILESPFTTITDVAYHHPLSVFHRYMPFFNFFFIQPSTEKETYFNSLERIHKITSPLMIMHAEDDALVPFEHGRLLYEKAKAKRLSHLKPPVFVSYKAELGYGHKYICNDPNLHDVVNGFLKNSKSL